MRDESHGTSVHDTGEGKGAFGGFVGPQTLVSQALVAAPYLFDDTLERARTLPEPSGTRVSDALDHPFGWWLALRAADRLEPTPAPTDEQRTDYFALCLGAHFATAGTYVPTDVDAKIRHALWFEPMSGEERDRMRDLALGLARWDVSPVSARLVHIGDEVVSGHDGERLSVLTGGLLAHLAAGDERGAAELERAVDDELAREARAFDAAVRGGDDHALVDLATSLTHNAGDVVQALRSKSARAVADGPTERFGDLARSGESRYGGAFARAARVYRETAASEGHRHYPLRDVRALRTHPDLLLPLGPYLDAFGERVATWPTFGMDERAAFVAALANGCKRVKGQVGYYRALAGFEAAHPRGLEHPELVDRLGNAAKRMLADKELRKQIAIRRSSFESSVGKRARAALAG
ncbi:MAG: hypothetical protein R3F34_13445 [Planctomycetota bacterium]